MLSDKSKVTYCNTALCSSGIFSMVSIPSFIVERDLQKRMRKFVNDETP
jgi:hypothetical protein